MKHREFHARRLDVISFAEEGATLQGSAPLSDLPRLAQTLHADANAGARPNRVTWTARGEQRRRHAVQPELWLHLHAEALLPLVCQRCLAAVETPLTIDRWIRFAATEAQAAALDAESDDDVLSLDPPPDLLELVEDELLLDAPIVPRHERCPQPLPTITEPHQPAGLSNGDAPEGRRQPFAALAALRGQLKADEDDSQD